MNYRIGIIDYGMGNLRSVEKGFGKAGFKAEISDRVEELMEFDALVLPGVGAFGNAMNRLRDMGMDKAILDYIDTGRNMLGICLGMQLFLTTSYEHGEQRGLGVIPGKVKRLPDNVKVPHMGWNSVSITREVPLWSGIEDNSMFYFVHSYYCDPDDDAWTTGTSFHGKEFACAVGRNNVWGFQFHPEKSSTLGLRILKNFAEMAPGGTT
ncbi:MAG: imidazole glycerol phosphate synthase subunit HisH [Actinobacteria bacterium]|nr:imidazole glycerol phosphate synthase subunit HisH [Actinomycetota bacterium]